MKRLSLFAITTLLAAGMSLPAWSQAPKPPDPCAQYKTAPKGESAADKKKRQADLKSCMDKEKADAKAAKQKTKPATKAPAKKGTTKK